MNVLGLAVIVRRRGHSYFDCRPWANMFLKVSRGPGAVVLNDKGDKIDIQTGVVYKG